MCCCSCQDLCLLICVHVLVALQSYDILNPQLWPIDLVRHRTRAAQSNGAYYREHQLFVPPASSIYTMHHQFMTIANEFRDAIVDTLKHQSDLFCKLLGLVVDARTGFPKYLVYDYYSDGSMADYCKRYVSGVLLSTAVVPPVRALVSILCVPMAAVPCRRYRTQPDAASCFCIIL